MNPNDLPLNQMQINTQLPIFWMHLGHMDGELQMARSAIDELRISHPESTPSNVKAVYMSPWKSHTLNEKLMPLCNATVEIVTEASRRYMNTDMSKLNFALRVTDCWGVIYEKSDTTTLHNHFPADFSAVVYLEAGENCAPIIFSESIVVKPKPKTIIIFPGILQHRVPENEDNRVIVAMNLNKFPEFKPAAAS